jgi:hypothetical protein
MKRLDWRYQLAVGLVAISLVIYTINYLIFRDFSYMLRLMVGQLAFLPISVIFVTIVINQLLANQARVAKMGKLNMVIGAYFSEVGTTLLRALSQFDEQLDNIRRQLASRDRSKLSVAELRDVFQGHQSRIAGQKGDLAGLQKFLFEKRLFLLRLLENPNLLEHETFTNLLWGVFHLGEELAQREDVTRLSRHDYKHLAGDIERAYGLLIAEWLAYMEHLERYYPYLFSLAMRINPFDPTASAEIE